MSGHGSVRAEGRPRTRRTLRRVAVTAVLAVVSTFTAQGWAPAAAAPAAVGQGFTVTAGDLAFILKQIRISERHSATLTASNPCGTLVGPNANQIPDRLTAYGLRTVDGSCNNLFPGREAFAAADEPFPRLTTPRFRDAEPAPPGFPSQASSSYAQKVGFVYDSEPRLVSNLIVDQTSTNPAAIAAAAFPVRTQGNPGLFPCTTDPDPVTGAPGIPTGCVPSHQTLFIPNVTTDVGLSPPYNSMFTFFGQFFDHGVDQTVKGGGTVFVPLKADDPLRTVGPDGIAGNGDEVPPSQAFMVLTRAQNQPGPDGVLGTADDVQDADNTDSPWVDQSQTYTSHASHQVFLREYDMVAGVPVSTGRLLGGLPAGETYDDSPDGRTGMATWASTKKQAAEKLGLLLSDADVTDIPMLATDPYGEFIPGPQGLPQYVLDNGTMLEGDLLNPVPVPANARHFATPFLTDIAHNADPSPQDTDHNPGTPPVPPTADVDLDTNGLEVHTPSADFGAQPTGTYDDEMLNAHFIAGDGRVNENIALSTIHQVFHSEHDRLVGDIQNTLDAPGNEALKAAYLAVNTATTNVNQRTWGYGDRLFQAARFVTEMEYQHLVFEEFGRKVQPAIRPFHVYSPDINPAIQAEFAHAVYRFGHSMLDDTVARTNADGSDNSLPLLTAFLNPPAFFDGGGAGTLTPEEAAGSIVMGSSDQVGNELDEFVTETLRNNLLGLPLDLATLNLARARDAGVPRLNDVRRQIWADTNDGQLTPYTDWSDFGQHLKHPESLINFVAAYGTHPSITGATTAAAKRAAAKAIIDPTAEPATDPADIPADAAAFLFSTDGRSMPGCDQPGTDCRDWSNTGSGVTVTGVDDVDLWVGGLAEITNLGGGLLGSTFNYVFQTQMESLQDGDRFYYLLRTPGMNLRTQLEGNSFAEMIQRNTEGTNTLKADAFATADCKFQLANLAGTPAGFTQFGSTVADDPSTECKENLLLLRKPDGTIQYRQFNTVDPSGINGQAVYNGTNGSDRVFGGNDNDTFWGGGGRDFIEGNGGDDVSLGGDGNDIITDLSGADVLKGGPGNDALDGGIGDDLFMGGDGKDFINGGANDNETFAGPGDDFVIAGQGADAVFGDGGDDWIQGGSGQDLLIGDHGAPFFDDPAETAPGHDVFVGQVGENDYDAEGGDDIMSQNAAVDRNAGAGGFDWAIHQYDTVGADDDMAINNFLAGAPIQVVVNRDRWQEVEGDSGSAFDDLIKGTDDVPAAIGGGGFTGCNALDPAGVARITGLGDLVTSFPSQLQPIIDNSAAGFCPLAGAGAGATPTDAGTVWAEGDILLGGGGNDTLEGRGADDIIDGDKALTVRISVRTNPADPATEIGSTDLMEHKALTGGFGLNTAGETLQKAVFDGDVDPGNLVIVREIVSPSASDSGSIDTAVFSGPRSNYTIAFGTAVTVTQTGANVVGQKVSDGIDTLTHVERLRFTDQTVVISAPAAPTAVSAIAGNAQATVSWTAPVADGSPAVTGYELVVSDGRVITGIPAGTTSRVVNALTNGTAYTFQVRAQNVVGFGPLSAPSNSVTPTAPNGPQITSRVPDAGATGVAVNANVDVFFDQAMTANGFNTGTVRLLNPAGAQIAATVAYSAANLRVRLNPSANLAQNTTYTVVLTGGATAIRSAAGVPLTDTSWTFRTIAPAAPLVTTTTPTDGATAVARGANILANFSQAVTGVSGTTFLLRNSATGTLVPAVVTLNAAGTRATLNPNAALPRNTVFTVTLTGGASAIRSLATGLPLATTTWSFTSAP